MTPYLSEAFGLSGGYLSMTLVRLDGRALHGSPAPTHRRSLLYQREGAASVARHGDRQPRPRSVRTGRLDRLLGVSSLWLEDVWVALVHRADTAREVLLTGRLTAPGFAVALKGWFSFRGLQRDSSHPRDSLHSRDRDPGPGPSDWDLARPGAFLSPFRRNPPLDRPRARDQSLRDLRYVESVREERPGAMTLWTHTSVTST